MKLYLLTQIVTTGYDTYDACVVAAYSEEDAKTIHPSKYAKWDDFYPCWALQPNQVTATLIGDAEDNISRGVVLASFNAG